MDEMNNMNEVAIEETSNEVTPVVAENNEVQNAQAESCGINTWAGVGVAVVTLTIGAAVAAAAKHKAEIKAEKEQKAKKRIKFRKPWEVVEVVEDERVEDTVDDSAVEETEEEN